MTSQQAIGMKIYDENEIDAYTLSDLFEKFLVNLPNVDDNNSVEEGKNILIVLLV